MRGADVCVEVSHDHLTVITVSGEIDLSNVESFRSAISRILSASASGFAIDFTRMSFIDSTGITAIIHACREVGDSSGKIVLVGCNPNVKRVFELIHLTAIPCLSMCEDMTNAARLLAEMGG